ncbi:hypothetical protein TPY_1994 [Sulfobacillus acidophilus TPY]|uniref:Copper chaperone PCu(A)C n=1 Tax=Sulfobacillus acidophilus (strain ATCC 700253 / DSM 10332 / NAL) TaxID=679936 RepID=G8TTJ7_SULAD|nr:hypothetical protein TPY_1994 [Sulfobacillus acidophilus TPY]AEW05663.1 hypothetical protein Sulac_2185 [Sulfobacillus acidophilus DSM 10332]
MTELAHFATKLAGMAIAGGLVLVSGVAFAHDHPDPGDHGDHAHQVFRGVFESGSLTGPSIEIKTTSGKLVTIDLAPTTRISLEAQGTAAGIMAALNNHQLQVTAQVMAKNKAWVATGIEAHLNVAGKDHSGDHQGSDHQSHDNANHSKGDH